MKKTPQPILIIGNGIAGITLAIQLRKRSNLPIIVVSDEHPYFFSRTALMYVYMGHMKWEHLQPYEASFWDDNKITLIHERITGLNSSKKEVILATDLRLSYRSLVLATGSKPNRLDLPGINALGVQGLYHKKDLEQLERLTPSIQSAVVVGGGLIGVELAEMLHSRGIEVHFLIRENAFWNTILPKEEAQMIGAHIEAHGVKLYCNTELKAIETDAENRVRGVITHKEEQLPCQFVGLTIGVHPNIDCFRNSGLETDRGILVDEQLTTNLPDVYAIGDCAQLRNPPKGRKATEAVWYSGRMMGETLAETLSGNPQTYTPGPWFNSAKFFDIEYQTYGLVGPQETAIEAHWYWQHPKQNCSFRVAYNKANRQFLGVHSLGIRLRHKIFHQWLLNEKSIDQVMEALTQAHFDAEFSTIHLKTIQAAYFKNRLQTTQK
jgi:NAD(P)H-nitrite reductase large subunit